MSAFRSLSSPLPKSLPLRGDDYVVRSGHSTITKEHKPIEMIGEGTRVHLGDYEQITVDRPGEDNDVILMVFDDEIRVHQPEPSRSVTIRREHDRIEFDRFGARRNDSTLRVKDKTLSVDRSLSRNDVSFKDDGTGFKIDRFGAGNDVSGSSSGWVRSSQRDRLPAPEVLAFVDHALDNGLKLDNMVRVTESGQVLVWDELLI